MNCLTISGELIELEPLRATPAGVPVLEFSLAHDDMVVEAGVPRRIQCDISVLAMGDLAMMYRTLSLGAQLEIQGFIAPIRRSSQRFRLHAEVIRIVEPDSNTNS